MNELQRRLQHSCIVCRGLKGKFPQTTMWVGWVESKFRNPTVKFWANFDNPFKRTNCAKFCMSPSLERNYARICDITRGQLAIDFVHRISRFFFFLSWISIVQLIKFKHKCNAQIILALTYPSIKVEGRCISMKSEHFVKFVYISIRQLYCCDITDISTVPPERVAYKKLTRNLKNHSSWLDYPNLPKLLLLDF